MPKPVVDPHDSAAPPAHAGAPRAAHLETPEQGGNPLLAALGAVAPIELAAPRRQAPVFRGTVVIYLGTQKHHSVALRGNVAVTSGQDLDPRTGEVIEVQHKEIPEDGGDLISSYDFATKDSLNRPILSRLVPYDHPTLGMYAGKPVQLVEHPDHLFYFYRKQAAGGGQEYAVVCPPERQQEMVAYFLERARNARSKDDEIASIQANATAAA